MSRPRNISARTARDMTRRMDAALADAHIPPRPRSGWLRSIREALGMTHTQMARRMGIARQNAARVEKDELAGRATVLRLQKAADALGCDLQYVLVPRKPLEKMIAEQATRKAQRKLDRINASQALEASAVATKALDATIADLAQELALQRPADLWDE